MQIGDRLKAAFLKREAVVDPKGEEKVKDAQQWRRLELLLKRGSRR